MKLSLQPVGKNDPKARPKQPADVFAFLLDNLPDAAALLSYPDDLHGGRGGVTPNVMAILRVNEPFRCLFPHWNNKFSDLADLFSGFDRQFYSVLADLPRTQTVIEQFNLAPQLHESPMCRVIEARFGPVHSTASNRHGYRILTFRDISQQIQTQEFAAAEATILARARVGGSAIESLLDICALATQALRGCGSSVFIRGQGDKADRYRRVTADRLPASAVDDCVTIPAGSKLGQRLLSGPSAPFPLRTSPADPIASFKNAEGESFRGIWICPIRSADGTTQGFLAIYHRSAHLNVPDNNILDFLHDLMALSSAAMAEGHAGNLQSLVTAEAQAPGKRAVHCFWEVNRKFKITHLSHEFVQLFRLQRSVIANSSAIPFLRSLSQSESVQSQLFANLRRRTPFENVLTRYVGRDGNARYLHLSGRPVCDEEGRFTGYRGVITDVTDDYALRYRTKLAERRLAEAIEGLQEGFLLFNKEQKLVLNNDKAREIAAEAGCSLKAGESIDVQSGLRIAPQAIENNNENQLDARIRTAASRRVAVVPFATRKWLRITEHATDEGGMVVLWSDVSAERQREAQLQASERRFEDMTNNLPGVVFQLLVDEKGRFNFSFISSGLKYILDIEATYAIANPRVLLDAMPHEDFRTLHQNMSRASQTGEAWSGIFRLRCANGEMRWMRGNARPERLADGTVRWNGLVLDITRQRLIEKDLKRAKESAEVANKTKTAFLANVSHELRTPLNAIIGFSDVVRQELFGPIGVEKYREYNLDIYESGKHLLNIINDLMDISKIESGHVELDESALNLAECIDACIRMVQEQAEAKRISIEKDYGTQNLCLQADERKIKQVLLNVLSNAVKFTPETGNIQIELQFREAEGVIVRIRDSGIGMRLEDQAVALSMFGRVHRDDAQPQEGAGIGLPLSKALMECHGGGLELQSIYGQGTTVSLTLPSLRLTAY